jgi:hypothetical protein
MSLCLPFQALRHDPVVGRRAVVAATLQFISGPVRTITSSPMLFGPSLPNAPHLLLVPAGELAHTEQALTRGWACTQY